MSTKTRSRSSTSFGLRALPFFFLMGVGSWGLSQFLKLPVQLKDDRAKRIKAGREKFSLEKEHERLETQLGDKHNNYENKPIAGPKPQGRRAAD